MVIPSTKNETALAVFGCLRRMSLLILERIVRTVTVRGTTTVPAPYVLLGFAPINSVASVKGSPTLVDRREQYLMLFDLSVFPHYLYRHP